MGINENMGIRRTAAGSIGATDPENNRITRRKRYSRGSRGYAPARRPVFLESLKGPHSELGPWELDYNQQRQGGIALEASKQARPEFGIRGGLNLNRGKARSQMDALQNHVLNQRVILPPLDASQNPDSLQNHKLKRQPDRAPRWILERQNLNQQEAQDASQKQGFNRKDPLDFLWDDK